MNDQTKNDNLPAYRTLAEALLSDHRSGRIPPDTPLPAERILAEQYRISRATVRKAIQFLSEQGYVRTVRGSGSYFRAEDASTQNRKAEQLISMLICAMQETGYSPEENKKAAEQRLWEALPKERRSSLIWMECNPEVLAMTSKQIERSCVSQVIPRLIPDVMNHPELAGKPDSLLACPIGHAAEIQQMFPERRLVPIAMRISPKTIKAFNEIPDHHRVAVIHQSDRYLALIRRTIALYQLRFSFDTWRFQDPADLESALSKYDSIILPDLDRFPEPLELILQKAGRLGKSVLRFQYILDQGSLLHINDMLFQHWAESMRTPVTPDPVHA